jgi:transcriptional regulator with XRE-family HTH domain
LPVALPNLKAIRESRFLTQEQLAQEVGMSRSAIARIELGGAARLSTVPKLAKALGVKPEQLVGEP